MNRLSTILCVAGLALTATSSMAQLVVPAGFTGSYFQNFDSLPIGANAANWTWTNGSTLPGWYAFQQNGTGGPGTWTVPPLSRTVISDGTQNSGALYSYGTIGNTNRALGLISSGTSGNQDVALALRNDSAQTYNSITVTFTGEQWRNGGNIATQKLTAEYQIAGILNESDLATNQLLGWLAVGTGELDFTSPIATATGTKLDGDINPNRSNPPQTFVFNAVSWAPGDVFYIRWNDINDAGNDHGLAIDDLTVTAGLIVTPSVGLTVVPNQTLVELVGSPVTYTVSTFNGATAATTNGTVTFTLPANVAIQSSSPTAILVSGTTYRIDLGPIAASSAGPQAFVTLTTTAEFNPLALSFIGNPGNNVTNNNQVVIRNNGNIQVTVTKSVAGNDVCTTGVGSQIDYVVTVTNAGPASAAGVVGTVNFLANLFPGTPVVSGGGLTNFGNVYTWTIGALNAGDTRTFTAAAIATGSNAHVLQASASSTTFDSPTTDNSRTVVVSTPATGPQTSVVVTSVPNASSSEIFDTTVFPGTRFGPTGTTRFNLGRPFASPNGVRWALAAETNLSLLENAVIVTSSDLNPANIKVVARESVTTFPAATIADPFAVDQIGTTAPSIQRILAINDSGQIAFSTRTNNADSLKRALIARANPQPDGTYTYDVIARRGDNIDLNVLPVIDSGVNAGQQRKWGATLSVAKGGLSPTGDVSFSATSEDGQIVLNTNGTTLISRSGQTAFAPTNPISGDNTRTFNTYANNQDTNFATTGFSITSDRATWMVAGPISEPLTTDRQVIVLNTPANPKTVMVQANRLIPGSSILDLPQFYSHNQVDDDGHWHALITCAPITPAIRGLGVALRNGVVIAQTGAPIITGSFESWSNAVVSSTFTGITSRGNDYVMSGLTSNPDTTADSLLVHNGTTVLLREGDPIDLGIDINTLLPLVGYAGPFLQDNRMVILADRTLLAVVDVKSYNTDCSLFASTTIGQALIRISLPATGPDCLSMADVAGDSLDTSYNPNGSVGAEDLDAFIAGFIAENVAISDVASDSLDTTRNPNGSVGAEDLDAFIAAFIACS